MNIVSMENITFRYAEVPVLQNMDLEIREEEYVLLTGENGSGKSTLLKLLLGELQPQEGRVQMFGKDPGRVFSAGEVGYVPQNSISHNQNFPATVEEIMMTGLYRQIGRFRLPGRIHRECVCQTLEELGMERFLKKRIGELSGGQQQRVAIARALASMPAIILADEPTGNLDSATSQDVLSLLKVTSDRFGQTVVMITHNEEIAQMADRIVRIEDGKIKGRNARRKGGEFYA